MTRREMLKQMGAMSLLTVANISWGAAPGRAKPFIKWAGGKGQLLGQLDALLPKDLAKIRGLMYVEPFVGGGAMLFHVLTRYPNIERVVINDLNSDLIATYRAVKTSPQALIAYLGKYQAAYDACANEAARKAYYLEQRALYNARKANAEASAARFIFLNRTGFNGLYRVNSKGEYNVPFGKAKHPRICDEATLLADSALLQKVEILCGDFEGVSKYLSGKAFLYFDPPYRPLPGSPSFTAYAKEGFNDDQQRRLAAFCRRLDHEGYRWLLSNSDPANTDPSDRFFQNLYAGFEVHKVKATRAINAKGSGRGKITELAIRNYKDAQ